MRKLWQKGFLAALEETGSVTEAAKAANMGRSNVYQYRRSDETFAALWDQALDVAADVLEDEARRRAYEGVNEPVFHKGEKVGTVRKYSDTLLMFLLKGIRPQKWRESRATIPPAELNKMIETELHRIAKQKEVEALEPVN
jgi:AcrR family transcriptional regulator